MRTTRPKAERRPRTTATRTTRIEETYTNPTMGGTQSIRYFVDYRNGDHVVVYETFNDYPNVYRRQTVEQARADWRRLRDRVAGEGFTQRTR